MSMAVTSRVTLVGTKILTAVVMKGSVFENIRAYSPVKIIPRFPETFCLHSQNRRIGAALLATSFTQIYFKACSSTLKKKVYYSSEISGDF
jgi:hypothetical protein